MNKSELSKALAERLNTTNKNAEETVEAVLDLMGQALKQEGKVSLSGFGTFEVKERGERDGRNPLTGEPMHIEARNAVVFRAGKWLKQTVND